MWNVFIHEQGDKSEKRFQKLLLAVNTSESCGHTRLTVVAISMLLRTDFGRGNELMFCRGWQRPGSNRRKDVYVVFEACWNFGKVSGKNRTYAYHPSEWPLHCTNLSLLDTQPDSSVKYTSARTCSSKRRV